MKLSVETPAILFPAISLIILAYTTRYLAIASLIRKLYSEYKTERDPSVLSQIRILRRRVRLIRDMQILGTSAIFLCVLSMFLIFKGYDSYGEFSFGFSLVLFLFSMSLSVRELIMSTNALNIQLEDIEEDNFIGIGRLGSFFRGESSHHPKSQSEKKV